MSTYLDVIILAAGAIFLILRLRGILGIRNGSERQRPNPYVAPAPEPEKLPPARGQIVDRLIGDDGDGDGAVSMPAPMSVAAGLTQIKLADASFDEKQFLTGARKAFEIIVTAFSQGDEASLTPLLSDEVMRNFKAAIASRKNKKETLESQILRIKDTDIIGARVTPERLAFITVAFTSDQINVTRDEGGQIVDGNPDHAEEIIDRWIFRRDTRSDNPNWILVATGAPA